MGWGSDNQVRVEAQLVGRAGDSALACRRRVVEICWLFRFIVARARATKSTLIRQMGLQCGLISQQVTTQQMRATGGPLKRLRMLSYVNP